MSEKIKFPVYRKYLNDQSYFKIINESSFDELKKESDGFKLYCFEAKILPDRNYIADMIHDYQQYWIEIPSSEYERILALI